MHMAVLGCAVALALGVSLGIFVERRLGRPQDAGERGWPIRSADAGAPESERLLAALGNVERTLAELTRALERWPGAPAPAGQRTPLPDDSAAAAPTELASVLQDLAASLRRLESSGGSGLSSRTPAGPLQAPGFVDRPTAFRSLAEVRAATRADDDEAWDAANLELQRFRPRRRASPGHRSRCSSRRRGMTSSIRSRSRWPRTRLRRRAPVPSADQLVPSQLTIDLADRLPTPLKLPPT